MEAEQKSSDDDAGTEVQDSDANLKTVIPQDQRSLLTVSGLWTPYLATAVTVMSPKAECTVRASTAHWPIAIQMSTMTRGLRAQERSTTGSGTERQRSFPFTTEDRPDVRYGYFTDDLTRGGP